MQTIGLHWETNTCTYWGFCITCTATGLENFKNLLQMQVKPFYTDQSCDLFICSDKQMQVFTAQLRLIEFIETAGDLNNEV